MADSLRLIANLRGKAQTAGEFIQVTLQVGGDYLHLNLLPRDAAVFPNLNQQEGGAHALYDPARITYNSPPQYYLTIAPIPPEPVAIEQAQTVPATPQTDPANFQTYSPESQAETVTSEPEAVVFEPQPEAS